MHPRKNPGYAYARSVRVLDTDPVVRQLSRMSHSSPVAVWYVIRSLTSRHGGWSNVSRENHVTRIGSRSQNLGLKNYFERMNE